MDLEKIKLLFKYSHLPPHLQAISIPFHDMAIGIYESTDPSPEQTLALRKLWEVKNLVVWAAAGKSDEDAPKEPSSDAD